MQSMQLVLIQKKRMMVRIHKWSKSEKMLAPLDLYKK